MARARRGLALAPIRTWCSTRWHGRRSLPCAIMEELLTGELDDAIASVQNCAAVLVGQLAPTRPPGALDPREFGRSGAAHDLASRAIRSIGVGSRSFGLWCAQGRSGPIG